MSGFLGTSVPVWDAATVYSDFPEDNQDMLVTNTKLGSSLAKTLGRDNGDGTPQYPVILMRAHGFVATANSIEMAVCKGVYTAQNARVQSSAMGLGGRVQLFNEREAHDTGTTTTRGAVKPWPLWVAEVENCSIYRNCI
jgi:ribulose-5-phosphate 4-epimerase/fuculose-1-phosphate aldolase